MLVDDQNKKCLFYGSTLQKSIRSNTTCTTIPYQPGYTAPRPPPEETTIDIGGVWQISGTPFETHDPRILALADAESQLFETEYDDYNSTHTSGVVFYRSAATILLSLLVLRHGMSITDDGSDRNGDDDTLTSIMLFMTQIIGFMLPFYVVLWVISILQHRRQTQEAAALAATGSLLLFSRYRTEAALF